MSKQNAPALFVGHGSPMNALGENKASKEWSAMGSRLGKPQVIIAISAHWATRGTFVRTAADNKQIYDMYGFPQALYELKYTPPGHPEYANRIIELLSPEVQEDNAWGIDHGLWSVLCHMYPEADVPVVIVSIDVTTDPIEIFNIGQKLAPLRHEGAMILASGNIVHNLRMVSWDSSGGFPWADAFDLEIRDAIANAQFDQAIRFNKLPYYNKAIPTLEHYYPLLIALGAAQNDDNIEVWNEYRELGSMSMTSYLFESK